MLKQWLGKSYLGNSVEEWALALGVALAVWIALAVTRRVVIFRLAKIAKRTTSSVDDVIVEVLEATRAFSHIALAIFVASHFLELSSKATDILRTVVMVALLLQVGFWAQRGVNVGVAKWKENKGDSSGARTMSAAITFIGRLVIWSLVLVSVLSQLGVKVGAVVTGLGIGGIAVALAVQNVLGDLLASLSLYFDTPFDIGDFIVTGGSKGTVEKIGLRSTRVRALSGEQLVFPNAELANKLIQNYKRMEERRIDFRLGLVYGTPYDKLKRVPAIIEEIISGMEGVRFDRSHFSSYGDFSLVFETVYFVLSPDYAVFMDKQQSLFLALYERFEKEGLDFAFPTQTLHLVKEQA
ncbi:MAG: mechanosensitive ion channel family protein [Myxococcales bacterium]|nr:MAG: mechanosensitive ion channel family protein [Myxococcales bacterium]